MDGKSHFTTSVWVDNVVWASSQAAAPQFVVWAASPRQHILGAVAYVGGRRSWAAWLPILVKIVTLINMISKPHYYLFSFWILNVVNLSESQPGR